MKRQLSHRFEDVISVENLLAAWQEFVLGKRMKADVQGFALHLMDNILQLHADLVTAGGGTPPGAVANGSYRHGGYHDFHISDPKPRHIHKASVRDRLVHHAVYRVLYPFFDRAFIADSYSCRNDKGTHKALEWFRYFGRQMSQNNTRTCWVLQCDIRQFFATIDHDMLLAILQRAIPDARILGLLEDIIGSFSTAPGKGLPLGNLTSQLLVNVYMNEFDQFVKHRLKVKPYVRYADDFIFLSENGSSLKTILARVREYLDDELKLSLHPRKVKIGTLASGVDFLGWVHFPTHRVLRTTTKRGMFRRMHEHATPETLRSYLGLLRHGSTHGVQQQLLNNYWLWQGNKRKGLLFGFCSGIIVSGDVDNFFLAAQKITRCQQRLGRAEPVLRRR